MGGLQRLLDAAAGAALARGAELEAAAAAREELAGRREKLEGTVAELRAQVGSGGGVPLRSK